MIKRLKSEAGYSLVEVMAAIIILTIAILPMVGMFDMGLKVSTQAGKHDQARALANQQMERVKALSYSAVVTNYSPPAPTCVISLPQGFTCEMRTYYVGQSDLQRLSPAPDSGNTMEVVVTIRWDGDNRSYTTTGLKSGGLQSQ